MTDFSQDGIVANLHDFKIRETEELEKELYTISKKTNMELILPCLFSELEGKALPKILDEINKTDYINHVIIGLDKANESQAKKAWSFFKKLKMPFSILWNDGPNLKIVDDELIVKGLSPIEMGKGRYVWYCVGMALARGEADAIALHDCDIITYERRLLAKLFYPVANPNFNYEFCKGYYPRYAKGKLKGRASRL